jgi:hypothetical protein
MSSSPLVTPDAREPVPQAVRADRRPYLRWLLPMFTFVCGCLVGVGLTATLFQDRMFWMMKHPGPHPERVIEKLKQDLDLAPEQLPAVEKIVHEHDARMRQLHPLFDQNNRRFEAEISAVLNEGQREKWQARIKQMHSMFPPPPGSSGQP